MDKGIADKRIFVLINPQAGGGAAKSWWESHQPLLQENNIDCFGEYTAFPGSAGKQIRQAVLEKGAEAVLIVGGDGSLYDAVNGMIDGDKLIRPDLIFGFYPVGSGCDFSSYLYGGKKISLLDLICNGRIDRVDIGSCEHIGRTGEKERHYFINSFDMGAGADTCAQVNADGGRIKRITHSGKLSFLVTALKVLIGFSYTSATIEADGEVYRGEYIIAGAANGSYIGGGMLMFPDARIDDGRLDLLLVERRSKYKIFKTFPKIYSGRHLDQPGIIYTKAERVKISTEKALNIELDGEVPGFTDVSLHVLPGLLPLLMPEAN